MNTASSAPLPILYSFRRCPYAMRARMALATAAIIHEHREVALRNKPAAMIAVSPKATVPVLVLTNGEVLQESLDIMLWALKQNDPNQWLAADNHADAQMIELIERNDGPFKFHLDRMKYATRYPGTDPSEHRSEAVKLLAQLDDRLRASDFLFGNAPKLADIAIFPFVRQFAHADAQAFASLPLAPLQKWLAYWESSSLFLAAMTKHPEWRSTPGGEVL